MNKEGPYVTSTIDSFFDIVDIKGNKPLFSVKATVTSVISKDNFGNPWTLELLVSSCYLCFFEIVCIFGPPHSLTDNHYFNSPS